jgi:hypothetical protein
MQRTRPKYRIQLHAYVLLLCYNVYRVRIAAIVTDLRFLVQQVKTVPVSLYGF